MIKAVNIKGDNKMKKTKEQAFKEEVIALMYCGYSFDNAVQTALEHQEERDNK